MERSNFNGHRSFLQSAAFRITPLATAIVAGALVYYGTTWGPWAYSDGVGYLVSARNLLQGVGLGLIKPSGAFEPLVSHPPLYPLLLAALGSMGFELGTAARLIDALALALLVGFSGWSIARLFPETWAGPATSLLILINPHILLLFLSAMAEPLFLLAGLTGLLTLAMNLSRDEAGPPFLAGILVGLSGLARYPGLSFWIAGTAAIFVIGNKTRERIRDLLVFSALSLGPAIVFWLWGTWFVTSTSPRALASRVDIIQSGQTFIGSLANIIWAWKPIPPVEVLAPMFPQSFADFVPRLIGLTLLVGLVVWAAEAVRAWMHKEGRFLIPGPVFILLGLFGVSYLLFFFLGFSLTYPTPDVNQRTLSPILLAAIIALPAILFGVRLGTGRSGWARAAVLVIFAAVVAGYAPMTYDLLKGFHRTGAGYTGRDWQRLNIEQIVNQLGHDRPLVSNHPEAVLLYADRYPYDLASYLDPRSDIGGTCPDELYGLIHTENGALLLIGISGDPSQPDLDLDAIGPRLESACDLSRAVENESLRGYLPAEGTAPR